MPLSVAMTVGLVVGTLVLLTGVGLIATKHIWIYNECTCANGIFGIRETCPVDEAELCLSCDDGYYLYNETDTCLDNECQCMELANGIGETNSNCSNHQDFKGPP